MRRTALLPSLAAALFGCGGDGGGGGPPDASTPTPAEMIAGSAALDGTGFVAVNDGADVELVPGAQGGFHVYVNVRLRGAAGTLRLSREARRDDTDQLVLRGQPIPLEIPAEALDDWWENPHAPASFMCPTPVGIRVADQAIRFDVQLLSEDGSELLGRDELIVTPRCPAGDQQAFCEQICTG